MRHDRRQFVMVDAVLDAARGDDSLQVRKASNAAAAACGEAIARDVARELRARRMIAMSR